MFSDDALDIIVWLFWMCLRVGIALLCLLTIQTIIHWHGYWIPFNHLLIAGAAAIVATRMLIPWRD